MTLLKILSVFYNKKNGQQLKYFSFENILWIGTILLV